MLSYTQHLHLRCLLDSGKPMTKFQIYKIQPNGLESYFPLDFRRYFFNCSTDDFVARCGAIGCTSYFSVIYHLMILDTDIPLDFRRYFFNCSTDDFVARCGAIGCTSYFSVIYHLMILDTAISIFPLRFILIKNDLYFNCRRSILG